MKKLLLSIALLGSVLFSSASSGSFSDYTDINDLALIYIGSQHRPDWNKDLFRPYVMHTYADGTSSWNFDSFLMIEFMMWNKHGEKVSLGEYNGSGASKEDWSNLLDNQLGTKTGYGCRALDDLIDELIPVLGEPGHKHKVVMSIPVPVHAFTGWGKVGEFSLYFTSLDDKCTALQWYTTELINRWNAAKFKHLELDGVYWTNEAFWQTSPNWSLAVEMNKYYHKKGLKAYWIPYLSASVILSNEEFKKLDNLGIDQAFIQPNYYFNASTPTTNLTEAIEAAFTYDSGLEIEFEGKNFSYEFSTGKRSETWASNAGMYTLNNHTFYNRLVDYLDYFEAEDVFRWMPVAYYSGFQAVYDYAKTGNKKDQELMDRLSTIMNKRHQTTGWDKAPRKVAGINDAEVPDHQIAYGTEGGIYIGNDAAAVVQIYTLDGKLIAAPVAEQLHYGNIVSCQPGIYIVRLGSRSIKVAVR